MLPVSADGPAFDLRLLQSVTNAHPHCLKRRQPAAGQHSAAVEVMSAESLFLEHLEVIERSISFVCRRNRMEAADGEDFASSVKVKLIENDYEVVRAFQGRSSFSTFITVVIQRMFLDYRIHMMGKWHPSAEARRLGETAVGLERVLHRDGRSIDEALVLLSTPDQPLTRRDLEEIRQRLPERKPKRRMTNLDHVDSELSVSAESAEKAAMDGERREISRKTSDVLASALHNVPSDDRHILQLRFEAEMSVAQISRSLRLDQRALYRRIEKSLRTLRESLEQAGIARSDVEELFESPAILDFKLGNLSACPSPQLEAMAPEGKETR